MSSAEAHPAEPPRGKTAYRMQPNNWRGKVTNTLKKERGSLLFIDSSHQRSNMVQGRFQGGSGRRAEAHTRPARPKIPSAPSAFPFLGRLRRQAINPTPRRGKSLGDFPLRPEENSSAKQDRPEVRRPTECNPTTGEERSQTP